MRTGVWLSRMGACTDRGTSLTFPQDFIDALAAESNFFAHQQPQIALGARFDVVESLGLDNAVSHIRNHESGPPGLTHVTSSQGGPSNSESFSYPNEGPWPGFSDAVDAQYQQLEHDVDAAMPSVYSNVNPVAGTSSSILGVETAPECPLPEGFAWPPYPPGPPSVDVRAPASIPTLVSARPIHTRKHLVCQLSLGRWLMC